ncbi:S-protein homolog 3-like [Cicer arietinum]|uniref:S-protein homolog n=1 Tax=Cicer arietinum TaxID=3827 RepID=A0A1S2Z8S9_CICAR|nr:S-protein homolog 3-like [Cicer arietinum]
MHNVLGVDLTITNILESHMDLTVHCKSADDDLGVRVLQFNQRFGFSFKDRFIGRTQFYCSFQWNGEIKWFDVYIEGRGEYKGEHVNWFIEETGPCRSGICYEWNK